MQLGIIVSTAMSADQEINRGGHDNKGKAPMVIIYRRH